jgi:hypothetical protein
LAIATIIALGNLASMIRAVDDEASSRNTTNQTWIAMQQYAHDNPENFYFIDVYSSVPYSEKIFTGNVKQTTNYDIMGGWANKSPIYRKQLEFHLGPDITMAEALVTMANVYFINDRKFDPAWLISYYYEQGLAVTLEKVDIIAGKLEVYKLR